MLVRLLHRQEQKGKVWILYTIFFLDYYSLFYFSFTTFPPFILHYDNYYFPLSFTDADKNPVEDLTSLAALDIEDILSKTNSISRGILFNVHQSMLKE